MIVSSINLLELTFILARLTQAIIGLISIHHVALKKKTVTTLLGWRQRMINGWSLTILKLKTTSFQISKKSALATNLPLLTQVSKVLLAEVAMESQGTCFSMSEELKNQSVLLFQQKRQPLRLM
jgi:hypothetical protein